MEVTSGAEGRRTGESGFTLVEMIIVLIIMGVLAAVVSVSMVGMMGRGEKEGYVVDERGIQVAVSTFFADIHAYDGRNPQGEGWNEQGNGTSVHNYPTANGKASRLYPEGAVEIGGYEVEELVNSVGLAGDSEVRSAAIWMGLVSSGPGDGSSGPDIPPGDINSPLAKEYGPYLNEAPDSCSHWNSSKGGGSYTWIVGAYGRVYGVFEKDGVWYAGFSGTYP